MKPIIKLLTVLFALSLAASSALASGLSGEVSLGGRFVDGDNTEKSAKFTEYRDVDGQLTSDLKLFWVNDSIYLNAEAANLGYDDQMFSLKGGIFGKAKFSLLFDELTHNYSLDDRTIYAGVGTATLTQGAGVDPTDATTWIPIDFAVERQQLGAKIELTFDTPFFVAVAVTQTEKDGIIPVAFELNRRPHEGPLPVDFKTTDVTAKLGYRTKAMFAQLDATISEFDNEYSLIENWYSPNGVTETFTMEPDNEMWQIGGQFVLRDLPMNSVLAIRGSHAKLESDPVLTTADTFDGELTYTKAAVTLKSRPISALTTELSYSFLQKDNKAARFNYDGQDTHIFEYSKQHATLAGGYRINSDNRVKVGYDFLTIDRANEMRRDAQETDDHTVFVEWKNSTFDMATAKIRYEHLDRSSDFDGVAHAAETGTDFYAYVRPFDAADKTEDTIRLMLDMSPTDAVDLGLEFNYSTADYDKTLLGRHDETTQGIILDASVDLPYSAKLYAYVDYEKREISSRQVQARLNGEDENGDPFGPNNLIEILDGSNQDDDDFNWYLDRTDVTRSFGVKLEVPFLNERLNVSAGFDYQDNDGEADFSENVDDALVALEDIDDYDDYEQQTVELKAKYAINENMSVTTGYTYEKYEYDDVLVNDYENIVGGNAYFSGAYADLDYEANIGYVTLSYKF